MKNRRNLTPPAPPGDGEAAGIHATRRGGARREVSSRVSLKARSGQILEGWALNVSRGGVRVILEDKVDLAAEFEVTVLGVASAPAPGPAGGVAAKSKPAAAGGSGSAPVPQLGRVVWVQEEPDGVVIGIEFVAHAKA